ncbi:hypothetical protein CBE01nite_29660 [Clostridium beijerinckii]|uniref:Phage head morphogenesis protein n=1 Tax=Clostridium beijerinckii TaxID=1520 RepID=A0AB74VDD3_CLOBE|nr:hypothetical protein [Clostridium beijerinckii]NRZ28746.1 3-methyladenine DNA glycosylase Tag [Clostridium beijerinckii]NYB95478.1 3-methyladenine DNA glycosylase Tag [Clostridium beijerinckii]OOM24593.1 hypothetical protein CLBEI_20540 [Clostridium beijerinckii]QUN34424.1 phage head morphogenesis protein [Clostridium beijerinckii]SQB00622.1 NAD:arginine ADP-ribosyltransferase ART [Clostridium beijerinckii]
METKVNFTQQEEIEFIRGLYTKCNEDLDKVFMLHKENKDKLLQELALILLLYKINNNVMNLSYSEKSEIKEKFEKLIVKFTGRQVKLTDSVITSILILTVKNTFKFYGYKYTLEEVKDIVNRKYKGKFYNERIIRNENKVAAYLNDKVQRFINGNIDVNTIKDNIEKTYKQNKDNVITLAETELSRSENLAFLLFAKSIGIVEIIRNEVLDSRTCDECESIHNEVFNIEDAPDEIHPCCRGFNTILYSDRVED